MIGGPLHKLDVAGRSLAPTAMTVMLLLVNLAPSHMTGYERVAPSFALMSIYYWTIHRPDLLPMSVVFVIGLLQDLLGGGPLGLNALVLIMVQWTVLSQRGFFLSSTFPMLWLGFVVVVAGAAFVLWLAASIASFELVAIDAPVIQGLLTLALFPLMAWLLILAHRAFLHQI
ncbi:rod shape-determining protein MreD [uncultured Gammaproteobacteria bacterium]